MAKIDTREWKEFRVGDIIDANKCQYGKPMRFIDELHEPTLFTIAVVSGQTVNNGVVYYTECQVDESLILKNCLTISTRGEYSGTVTYHEDPFILSNNVLSLPLKEPRSKYVNLFIAQIISSLGYGGYDNYPRKDILMEDKIKLPTTPAGLPDFEYMEAYMKNLEITVSSSLTALQSAQEQEKKKIDVSGWAEFRISDLFHVYNGKKYPKQKRLGGDLPLISTSAFNNGISDYIEDREDSTYSNVITVAYSGSVGATFYHKNKVFVGETVIALVPKETLSEYNATFLCTILKENNKKYDYQYKIKVLTYGDDIIKLPVTSDGSPDWEYMESYMRKIEEKIKNQNLLTGELLWN